MHGPSPSFHHAPALPRQSPDRIWEFRILNFEFRICALGVLNIGYRSSVVGWGISDWGSKIPRARVKTSGIVKLSTEEFRNPKSAILLHQVGEGLFHSPKVVCPSNKNQDGDQRGYSNHQPWTGLCAEQCP